MYAIMGPIRLDADGAVDDGLLGKGWARIEAEKDEETQKREERWVVGSIRGAASASGWTGDV